MSWQVLILILTIVLTSKCHNLIGPICYQLVVVLFDDRYF